MSKVKVLAVEDHVVPPGNIPAAVNKAKVLIVEDQELTAGHIHNVLEENNYQVIGTAETGAKAIEMSDKTWPDVVLMDINIQGPIDGITTAKCIQAKGKTAIIFITQFSDDLIFNAAKALSPESYLVKPFTDAMLLRSVALALQNAEHKQEVSETPDAQLAFEGIFIPHLKNRKIKILFKDILYIEAERAYSKIYTEPIANHAQQSQPEHCCYKVCLNSGNIFDQLNYANIIKVHKSFYVNVDKIEMLGVSSVFIKDKEIPVSKKYDLDELKKKIKTLKFD